MNIEDREKQRIARLSEQVFKSTCESLRVASDVRARGLATASTAFTRRVRREIVNERIHTQRETAKPVSEHVERDVPTLKRDAMILAGMVRPIVVKGYRAGQASDVSVNDSLKIALKVVA